MNFVFVFVMLLFGLGCCCVVLVLFACFWLLLGSCVNCFVGV